MFIDDGNMWSSYKSMGNVLEYSKLKKFLEKKFKGTISPEKVFFYKAYPDEDTREYSIDPQQKFMTFLKRGLGFTTRTKKLKTILLRDKNGDLIHDKKTGDPTTIEKGNFDVEIAIDALHYSNTYDILILFSGDSDFLPLIRFLRNSGKKAYVFSTKKSVSIELKTGADGYFDLAHCMEIHGAKLLHRSEKYQKINGSQRKNSPTENGQAA